MDGSLSRSQEDVEDFLRPLLFGLDEEDLGELARAATLETFPAGAVICQEGESGDATYVIVQGRVEMVKRLDDESERHLHDSGPGELFGEMALLQEGTRTATVRAVEPTQVLRIGQEPFLAVLGRSPALAMRILVRLTRRLRDADQQSIAELRQANEELTQALRRLERLDRTKTDFIRVSAHELRTPVAALLGYAQMMHDNPIIERDAELRALVEGTVTSTERLHRIFNRILDLSRVMAGGISIRRTPVGIGVALHGIQTEFAEALAERDLELELRDIENLPFYPGDPDLIYKMFHHLMSNAIKYTPDGGRITVTGRVVEAPDLGPCIEVSIEDTGIGISPEDLDLIFEKFYRKGEVALHSSGATTFKGGGPGLGLAITQGIALAHGGRIWAESPGYNEEDCPGSRFTVQLPLRGRVGEAGDAS